MKCIILTDILKKKISTAERFTGKHSTLPVLSNIYFEIHDQEIKIIATNLETACILSFPVKSISNGALLLPSRSFTSYIQSLQPGKKVTLEEKNNSFFIESDSLKAKILTIPPKEFPLIPAYSSDKKLLIPVGDFQTILQDVVSSASSSQLKPELHGVFLSWNKKKKTLTCAATDTFRLAERTLMLDKNTEDDFSCIIPLSSVHELIRFESDAPELSCILNDSQIVFLFGSDTVISNIVHGAFPHYESIVPKTFDTHIDVHKKELMDAIKSTSFFSSTLQDIFFQTDSDSSLCVYSSNKEIGETTIRVPARIQGKSFRVAFNYKFFLDGLQSVPGERVMISLTNESSPARISHATALSGMYIIMPIKGA